MCGGGFGFLGLLGLDFQICKLEFLSEYEVSLKVLQFRGWQFDGIWQKLQGFVSRAASASNV